MPPVPRTDKPTPLRPPRARPLSQQIVSSVGDTSTSPPGGVRLGLSVSPGDAPPVTVLRPQPPSRIRPKRMSLSALPTNRGSPTLRGRPLDGHANGTNGTTNGHLKESASSSGRATPERFTGPLLDRTEDELARAGREALQNALRKEWADREKFLARIEDMDSAQRTHEERVGELDREHAALQSKYDAAHKEQATLEGELQSANEHIDRLRSSLGDAERQNRQGLRRYADQEKAFEAERLVHQAEQSHLHQRIKSLSAERVARNNDESHAALQEELVTLTASHQTLVAQLTTLADELHEVRADNGRLQEENDSWQLLIEERTLAGTMRAGLFSSSPNGHEDHDHSAFLRSEPNALDTLEEQLEMDELHSELNQQPVFEECDHGYNGGLSRVTSPGNLGQSSLAAELSTAPMLAELDSLRGEVKHLKESNKALSLYCSKILNRIISQDGYEQVLSLDYKTRRFGSRSASSGKARPTVEEMAKQMEANGPPPLPEMTASPEQVTPTPLPTAAPAAAPAAPVSTTTATPPPPPRPTRSRPQSMVNPSPPNPARPEREPTAIAAPKKETKEEKKAKRGFSIDFRSLGFGTTEPKVEPKPQLKPLQLASRAAPASSGTSISPIRQSPIVSIARKLEPQEEDEEDRRERVRMEATLKLMGIERDAAAASPASEPGPTSAPATIEAPAPTTSGAASWFARRLSRHPTPATSTAPSSASSSSAPPSAALAPASAPTPPTSTTPTPPERASTPLARLSMVLGGSSDALDLQNLNLAASEDEAAAVLRAYDAREREQARLIAAGKLEGTYTSPPRRGSVAGSIALQRNMSSKSTSSLSSTISTVASAATPNGPSNFRTSRGRESVSTLWSMGSSRASVDMERPPAHPLAPGQMQPEQQQLEQQERQERPQEV